jgi:hypothetical protein
MTSFLDRISALRVRKSEPGLITLDRILAWADAHKAATGKWPTVGSGQIDRARYHLSWRQINAALKKGRYTTPGMTLAMVLDEHRGVKAPVSAARESPRSATGCASQDLGPRGVQKLSVERILAWADAHRAATGRWPRASSGPIAGVRGDNWRTVHDALRLGHHGLPGNTTLARLLQKHRGVRPRNEPADLTEQKILRWADAHHKAHHRWPSERSGPVAGTAGETWPGVNQRLRYGGRGLPGGSSLSQLLSRRRRPRGSTPLADLSVGQILTWADAHRAASGKWPHGDSGRVADATGETWKAIDQALRDGWRSLPGGSSLARLLEEHRPRRSRALTPEKIRAWAEEHRAATGSWPTVESGAVAGAPGDTWSKLDKALRQGYRGLAPGSSLASLLGRGPAPPRLRPDLTLEQVFAWAEAHRAATGRWPCCRSGPIPGAPGEDWNNINNALRLGRRGLPPGVPLSRLFPGRKTREIKTWSGGRKR